MLVLHHQPQARSRSEATDRRHERRSSAKGRKGPRLSEGRASKRAQEVIGERCMYSCVGRVSASKMPAHG